jgi:hypothetical protein
VNQAAIDEALEAARNKALDKLMLSLGLLTEEKIEPLKAKDLASVANSMANVVMKTLPQASPQGQINLVIYSPEIRSEKAFEVIEI